MSLWLHYKHEKRSELSGRRRYSIPNRLVWCISGLLALSQRWGTSCPWAVYDRRNRLIRPDKAIGDSSKSISFSWQHKFVLSRLYGGTSKEYSLRDRQDTLEYMTGQTRMLLISSPLPIWTRLENYACM